MQFDIVNSNWATVDICKGKILKSHRLVYILNPFLRISCLRKIIHLTTCDIDMVVFLFQNG